MRQTASARAQVAWTKLLGYAGINENKALYKSDSLDFLRAQYESIEPRYRDRRIGQLLDLIEHAPPSRAALVEYLVTLYRLGFEGCELSQELLCSTIRRVTHARRFSPRTLRDAAAWAARAGLISISWVPIGTKYQTDSGDWRTRQIRRYKLTYKVRFLVSLLRVKKSKVSHLVRVDPTLADFAANPNGENAEGGRQLDPPSAILLRLDQNSDMGDGTATAVESNEVSPKGDMSTCPPSSHAQTATGEHRASKRASHASAIEKSASRFAPRVVREHPQTYAQMRGALLHELFIALKPSDQFSPNQIAYQIADAQTSQLWPEWFPVACSWWPVLCDRASLPWAARRRQIDRDIIPALHDFAAAWTPPQLADLDSRANQHTFDVWELALCPPPGIAVRPADLAEYFAGWPTVRRTLSAIYDGRIQLSEATLSPVFRWIRLIGCR